MRTLFLIIFSFGIFSGNAFSAPDPYELVGIYDIRITIGDRVFNDILHINSASDVALCRFTKIKAMCGTFTGKLIVPDAFEAFIGKGKYSVIFTWALDLVKFKFEILARENGKNFRVYYEGSQGFDNTTLYGRAVLEDGSLLGVFEAHKREGQ